MKAPHTHSAATMTSTTFYKGALASGMTSAHRIWLDTDDGKLYYDADGSGAGSTPILFAQLVGTDLSTVTAADFSVTLV